LKPISIVFALLTSATVSAGINVTYEHSVRQEKRSHAHVLTPEEEKTYLEELEQKGDFHLLDFRFAQTKWYECSDPITGNFTNYSCNDRRGIAVILKRFMDDYLPQCVQAAMDKNDGGEIEKLHIIHDGILGDRRHSPRSLHAENRAIDIRAFRVTTYQNPTQTYAFTEEKNDSFYDDFRSCWGRAGHENNGCPKYRGSFLKTGSIGKEDSNHQYHLHTSVPYCYRGDYGRYYYKR
jgi:hypothetical protein